MSGDLPDFQAILRRLTEAEVEFVLVGGVGAVLHGVPMVTFDLDIVHRRTASNVSRLFSVLSAIEARYRGQGGRLIKPDPAHLASDEHHLLITRLGPLDVLGRIGRDRDFEALLPRTERVSISPGVSVPVLTLEAIIEIKLESGREKDLAALPILRRTLEEKRRP